MNLLPKVGQRIKLEYMDDPAPIETGATGTVRYVSEPWPGTRGHTIEVKWDNGRTLSLISDVDKFSII